MPRIRSVHPDICQSEPMSRLPAELERTFVRLWTHCDDEGRCIDNPRLVKAAIFPLHDDVTPDVLDDHLSQLQDVGLIRRYRVDGHAFVVVCSWSEYQRPQKKVASKCPPPPAPGETPDVSVREQSRSATGDVREGYGPVVGGGEGVGVGEGEPQTIASPPPANAATSTAVVVAEVLPVRQRRAPNALWDAVMAACEIDSDQIPESARGAYGKAVKRLKAVGATADEIHRRGLVYRAQWPDMKLTPTALERRWAECDRVSRNGDALRTAAAVAHAYSQPLPEEEPW